MFHELIKFVNYIYIYLINIIEICVVKYYHIQLRAKCVVSFYFFFCERPNITVIIIIIITLIVENN